MPLTTAVLAVMGLCCLYYAIGLRRWVLAQNGPVDAGVDPGTLIDDRLARKAQKERGDDVAPPTPRRRNSSFEAFVKPSLIADSGVIEFEEYDPNYQPPKPKLPLYRRAENDVGISLYEFDTHQELPAFTGAIGDDSVLNPYAGIEFAAPGRPPTNPELLSLDDMGVVDDFTKRGFDSLLSDLHDAA